MSARDSLPLLAILEERDRLSSEIQDGLARVLVYVITEAQAARQHLDAGQLEMAKRKLEELLAVTREAYADARDIIRGARRNGRGAHGLTELLTEHIERFRQQSGVTADLTIAPAWQDEDLTPMVQVQVLRIMQEALTNIRKHAAAHQVNISLAVEEGQAHIQIKDDGRGFFLSRHLPRLLGPVYSSHGLCTMRDRTRALGGTFRIESSPGRGTRILVRLPLDQPSEAIQS